MDDVSQGGMDSCRIKPQSPTRSNRLLKSHSFVSFHCLPDWRRLTGKINWISISSRSRMLVQKSSLTIGFLFLAALASAQTQGSSPAPTAAPAATSAPAVVAAPAQTTVSRTIKAMHYRLQGGSTNVSFHGTDLSQRASGEARVEGRKVNFEIEAKFQGFEDATKFGLEYLTYVLWAVSPQGRPVNLGELNLDHHGNAQLKAYTDLQSFGMIVTAEPYFAVTQPGNMVVAESSSISGTATENIDARYELVTQGTYSATNTRINDAIFG